MTPDKANLLALAGRGTLRLANGRFASRSCGDPNCGGEMVRDFDHGWDRVPRPILRCDGLTHLTDDGPLIACPRWEAASQ